MSRTFAYLEDLGWEARRHRRTQALRSWKFATVECNLRWQFGICLFGSKTFRQKYPAVRRTDLLQLWGKRFGWQFWTNKHVEDNFADTKKAVNTVLTVDWNFRKFLRSWNVGTEHCRALRMVSVSLCKVSFLIPSPSALAGIRLKCLPKQRTHWDT
jgi:hypothetical protein